MRDAWVLTGLIRLAAAAGFGAATIWLPAAAASAATSAPALQVYPNPVATGQQVTVYGSHFCTDASCSTVTVLLGTATVASGVRPDTSGTWHAAFTVGTPPGTYVITATQTRAGGTPIRVQAGVTVGAGDYPPGSDPRTSTTVAGTPRGTTAPSQTTASTAAAPGATSGPTSASSPGGASGGSSSSTTSGSSTSPGSGSALGSTPGATVPTTKIVHHRRLRPWLMGGALALIALVAAGVLMAWRHAHRTGTR